MSGVSNSVAQFVIGFIMFAAGAAVFSLLNVIIYRLPKDRPTGKGRSRIRCALIDVLGGVLSVIFTFKYGFTLRTLTIFLFFCAITVIAFIDFDTLKIPPVLNVCVFILGVISIRTLGNAGIADRIIGMFAISVPMLIVAVIVPGGFGGGDIKLMFAAGFLLGLKSTVAAFVIGLLTGAVYGIWLMITRRQNKKGHFAFGPFLCLGMAIALFWGDRLADWYIRCFMGIVTK